MDGLGLAIGLSAWKVARELRGTPWFPLAFAIFCYPVLLFFPMMFAGNSTYQDFVINCNLWLLLGVLFRLQTFPESCTACAKPRNFKAGVACASQLFPLF
jgi:hypothetical protein